MTKNSFLILVAICIFIPHVSLAASLRNNDAGNYRVRGRSLTSKEWNYGTIHSFSSVYFRCRYGCEIEVLDTGSTIRVDSDAEIAIDGGELRVRSWERGI